MYACLWLLLTSSSAAFESLWTWCLNLNPAQLVEVHWLFQSSASPSVPPPFIPTGIGQLCGLSSVQGSGVLSTSIPVGTVELSWSLSLSVTAAAMWRPPCGWRWHWWWAFLVMCLNWRMSEADCVHAVQVELVSCGVCVHAWYDWLSAKLVYVVAKPGVCRCV